MKYGLAYATKRAHCIAPVVAMWQRRAMNPEGVVICVGIDEGDWDCEQAAKAAGVMVVAGHEKNCVAAWNEAALYLSKQARVDQLLAISDDFVPPHHWDAALDDLLAENGNTRKGVIHVNDGGDGRLCTLPVIGSERYRRFGFLYYPGYESMFCDTELTARAQLDGVLIDGRHLLFEHLHPVNGKRPTDAVDKKHASQERWDRGKKLFNDRLMVGFPPHSESKDVPAVMADRYCASLQVTADDVCLQGTIEALFASGVRSFAFNVPLHHWDGSEVSKDDQDAIERAAAFAVQKGAYFVRVWKDSLAPFWFPGMSRQQLETGYRNSCLDRLRKLGFLHHLIVDGDEVWMPGTMAAVDYNVRWYGPNTLAVRGVPMLGLPAVAVEGAHDRILVYIGPDERWKCTRSPFTPTLDVELFGVLHFSGVRRTREEIVQKMKLSGHYDDKDYHFDEWIEKVLPNLRPGMRNVHMFKDGSLWPLTREVTDAEWAAVPAMVKPMLLRERPIVQTVDQPDRKAWALGEVKK